ncbi:preprotein translocase subunit YajC [Actinoplanes sp. G11-F43]|uniref:preprotein translocase subunit YajC n=1 Tax=Actinoplanes sp. G11-F43 TaxID=3424130 RepID=UPI003D33C7FF
MLDASDAPASGGNYSFLLILVLLFGFMYFVMIRPQQKQRRKAMDMQNSLGPGDQIVTIGGLHGTVTGVTDDQVLLEIAPDVEVRFARPAIARVVHKSGEEIPEPEAEAPVADDATPETTEAADKPEGPVTEVRKQD